MKKNTIIVLSCLALAAVGFLVYTHFRKKAHPAPAVLPQPKPTENTGIVPPGPTVKYAPIPQDEVTQILAGGGKLDWKGGTPGRPLILDKTGKILGIAESPMIIS